LIRIVIAACIVTLSASCAYAARSGNESRSPAPLSPHTLNNSTTRSSTQNRAQAKTFQPHRKTRRKNKTARHPNVFYRWSAEQLILGGVNPSRIGQSTTDTPARPASKSAASPK
jgi:hypothetical protein